VPRRVSTNSVLPSHLVEMCHPPAAPQSLPLPPPVRILRPLLLRQQRRAPRRLQLTIPQTSPPRRPRIRLLRLPRRLHQVILPRHLPRLPRVILLRRLPRRPQRLLLRATLEPLRRRPQRPRQPRKEALILPTRARTLVHLLEPQAPRIRPPNRLPLPRRSAAPPRRRLPPLAPVALAAALPPAPRRPYRQVPALSALKLELVPFCLPAVLPTFYKGQSRCLRRFRSQ
jgi:hypothetical protein